MSEVSLSRLEKAFDSLRRGYKKNPSELERDGIIQRFEFCIELCWKSSKKILQENGVTSDSPKNIFREMANLGWINDPKKWLLYLELRNEASYIYNEETADKILSNVENFIQDLDVIIKILKTKNK